MRNIGDGEDIPDHLTHAHAADLVREQHLGRRSRIHGSLAPPSKGVEATPALRMRGRQSLVWGLRGGIRSGVDEHRIQPTIP